MRLEFIPYPFLVGISILFIVLIILWRRKRTWPYLFFCAVFGFYLLILMGLTLFPIPILSLRRELGERPPMWQILARVNLVPFAYRVRYPGQLRLIVREMITNVVMTIPFGFGIIFIVPSWAKKMLWLAFLPGLVIEAAQLGFVWIFGVSYRVADINDVLLNTLGVWIGYGIFRVFAWTFQKIKLRFKLIPKGLFKYIDQVVQQKIVR